MSNHVIKTAISERTKRLLYDERATLASRRQASRKHYLVKRPIVRVQLSTFFHANYVDSRSSSLRQSQTWSVNARECPTSVTLSDEQIIALLHLAKEHDVLPYSPQGRRIFGTRGALANLVGTFIEAVVNGQLKEIT